MAGNSTVAVCSLAQSGDEFKHFISVLKDKYGVYVKYVHISSTILNNGHDFSQYDGVILIHSVFNGRMSLTDVKDARYQKLLLHWKSLLGRDRVAVIVTGVERTTNLEEHFQEKQPTVSECSAHVLFCEAGDPMNDDDVAKTMKSFVGLLPDRPKVRKGHSKPSKVTTQRSEDSTNKDTTIKFKKLKCAGIDVKNSKGKSHVELIICCEGSTEKTLLKTLSEGDLQDEADYLIFKQKAYDWELLEAKSISSFDPSSELLHCAVFIYRNGVPPNLSENCYKAFEKIINERTSPTLVEVTGKADVSCLQQLLKVFLDCAYNDHIVTISPGDVQMASSFSGNQTQREREHQYEATLKKEARGRIQILNRDIRTLKQDLSCKQDELATCVENISVKHREQKTIGSDLNKKYEELHHYHKEIENAHHHLNEIRTEFQVEKQALCRVKEERIQIHVKKKQETKAMNREIAEAKKAQKEVTKRGLELKEWESNLTEENAQVYQREIAVMELEYQIQTKEEQQSQESLNWDNDLKEKLRNVNEIDKNMVKVLQVLEDRKSEIREADDELQGLRRAIREEKEELNRMQERKEQMSEDLHDNYNLPRMAKEERRKENYHYTVACESASFDPFEGASLEPIDGAAEVDQGRYVANSRRKHSVNY